MTDAPERIGLLTDGLGYYALATAEESNTSTHYVRADMYDAQSERIAELEACMINILEELDIDAVYDIARGAMNPKETQ